MLSCVVVRAPSCHPQDKLRPLASNLCHNQRIKPQRVETVLLMIILKLPFLLQRTGS